MRLLLLAALASLLLGCDATLVNKSPTVFPVLTGTVEIHWQLSTNGVAEVDYELDGRVIASSTDVTNQFAIPFDSSKFANGLHELNAIALDVNDRTVQVLSHSLVIGN